MRVLVAIANHGTKNQRFLEPLLASYRAMPFDVDVVVCSDVDKDLGADVDVQIGAPSADPQSLPFAHRSIFAERVDDYDLFIYSEDDTLVTEDHVNAFLQVNELLPDDVIPGFMRYEVRPSGERSYCSIHSIYHWDAGSPRSYGGLEFAAFTNAHSAMYMATADQLRRAIASGGYLCDPHDDVYDKLVSAGTDLYTRCGLTRLICLTRIDDFLVHHLPNVYLDRMGITPHEFKLQLEALEDIRGGRLHTKQLMSSESKLPTPYRSRRFFDEPVFDELLEAVGAVRGPVLSVGCTTGRLESQLLPHAHRVVGIPVDAVMATLAADRGIQTTSPDLEVALEELDGARFDLVLAYDLIQHLPNPPAFFSRMSRMLNPGGRIITTTPNLWSERARAKLGRYRLPLPPRIGGFAATGVHYTDARVLRRWVSMGGCTMTAQMHHLGTRVASVEGLLPRPLRRWAADIDVVVAESSK